MELSAQTFWYCGIVEPDPIALLEWRLFLDTIATMSSSRVENLSTSFLIHVSQYFEINFSLASAGALISTKGVLASRPWTALKGETPDEDRIATPVDGVNNLLKAVKSVYVDNN